MAHRSDRRGETPITRVALEAVVSDWPPACGFHDGPEPFIREAPFERPKIRRQSDSVLVCNS